MVTNLALTAAIDASANSKIKPTFATVRPTFCGTNGQTPPKAFSCGLAVASESQRATKSNTSATRGITDNNASSHCNYPASVRVEKKEGFTVGVLDRPIDEKALSEALNEFP